MNKRRIAAGLATVAMGAVLSVSSQATASPSESADKALPKDGIGIASAMQNRVTQRPTWIFQCPSALCNRAENVFPEDLLTDLCYVAGPTVNNNPFWDIVYVRTPSKQYVGFVPEAYLENKTQGTHCNYPQ